MKNRNEFDLLGPKIRHFRQQKDYSQEYMAHALGLTQTSYSKIEKNAAELSLNRLSRICEILEIQLPDLLNEKGSTFYSSDNKGTNNQTHGSIIINNFPPELMQRLDALLDKLSNKTS